MTPSTGNLFTLQGQLFELLEAREEAQREAGRLAALRYESGNEIGPEDWQAAEAELSAIETGIAAFVAQKLTEVDELRAPLKALEQAVKINKADAEAATQRAMILQNRYDRLKDLIKLGMETLAAAGQWKPKEPRKFESARGSFTLRGNGGACPVEITDEALVPDEYCTVSVRFSASLWLSIRTECPDWIGCEIIENAKVGPREVSKSAIAAELAKPCITCRGTGLTDDLEIDHCQACGGTGTKGIPGARLAPRGQSLIVK